LAMVAIMGMFFQEVGSTEPAMEGCKMYQHVANIKWKQLVSV